MTEQQIKQAQQAISILDAVAAESNVNRAAHVNAQNAVQILRSIIAEAAEASKPSCEAPPKNVLPGPGAAAK